MKKLLLGSSSVTSWFGIVLGALVALQPIIEKDGFNLKEDWLNIVFAIGTYLALRRSKDTDGLTARQSHIIKDAVLKEQIRTEK